MDSRHDDRQHRQADDDGAAPRDTGPGRTAGAVNADRQANSASRLSDQAADQVGLGYDATQEAMVREQRRQGRADEDEDVSPG